MNDYLITLTAENFQHEVMNAEIPVLVDFWAPWCGACQQLNPIIEELAKEFSGRAKIAKLNIDDETELRTRFRFRGVPNVLIFRNGEICVNISGAHGKRVFTELLADQLVGKGADDTYERCLSEPEFRQLFLMSGEIERVRSALRKNPSLASEPLTNGITPISLMVATVTDAARMSVILEHKPELSVGDMAGTGSVQELTAKLKEDPTLANQPGGSGSVPLHLAIMNKQKSSVQALIDAGANVNYGNEQADNIILRAVVMAGDCSMLEFLVTKGLVLTDRLFKGNTALHIAARAGNASMVAWLLDRGLCKDAKNDDGNTALELARQALEKNPNVRASIELLEANTVSEQNDK